MNEKAIRNHFSRYFEKEIKRLEYERQFGQVPSKVEPILTKEETFKKLDKFDFKYIEQYVRMKKLNRMKN